MQNSILIANRFKKIGWLILIPSAVLCIIVYAKGFEYLPWKAPMFAIASDQFFGSKQFFTIIQTNITPTIVGTLFIIGALLVSFSKEKNEDEYIASIRLTSLLWAVLINSLLVIFAFIFIWGGYFFSVMTFSLFSTLIIFIIRFNFLLYRSKRGGSNE